MILVDLIQNIALLVALAAVFQVTVSRAKKSALNYSLLMGVLFGIVGVLGMMTPIHYVPGIIFDGRSIILAVAGLIGGPVVALVSASIAGAYRIWLGGGGALKRSLLALPPAPNILLRIPMARFGHA